MATVFDWLMQKFPKAKRQTLREMVSSGRVRINGRVAISLKQPISPTDTVEVGTKPVPPAASIEPLRIIHEDEDVLVVYKPPGLLTSTVPRELRPTAAAIVRRYLADREPQARAGVIHRLDREAEGLLVFSKNERAYDSLKKQFFAHSVTRIYTAVVPGVPTPPAGRIESNLLELPDGKVVTTRKPRLGQRAVTEYETVRRGAGRSLLKVTLHTGRKHQIRSHLAQRGHPIVGDEMYAAGKPKPAARKPSGLLLAATTLAFDHPRTGQRLSFDVPPPPAILAALEASCDREDTR